MPSGAASLGQEHRCSALLPDTCRLVTLSLSAWAWPWGKGSQPRPPHGPGTQGAGHGREPGCPGRRQEAASLSASSTSASSSTVQIQPLGISSQHRGAFNPKHGALLSNCPDHSRQSSLGLLPPAPQPLRRVLPQPAVLCPPLLPSETHPHLTSREASVSTPRGWRLPRAGTRGPLFSPRAPGACPRKAWLGLGG